MPEDITELYETIDTLIFQLAMCRKRNKAYIKENARLKSRLGDDILEQEADDEESQARFTDC